MFEMRNDLIRYVLVCILYCYQIPAKHRDSERARQNRADVSCVRLDVSVRARSTFLIEFK